LVTAVGSLGVVRAIEDGIPGHIGFDNPPAFPTASPPNQAVPPTTPSLASMLAVLSAAPRTPGVSVDPGQAQQILDSLWPIREQALDSDDAEVLADFENGSALQGDIAVLTAGFCGCPDPQPRTIATRNLFVPRQTTYPSWFVSEVTTGPVVGSTTDVSLMVFTRASAQARWTLSLETGYSFAKGAAWVYATPESIAGGFDLATAPHNELPADLGAYEQYWADTGTAPPSSPFATGVFTTGIGQTQATLDKTLAAAGQVHRVVYSVDPVHDGDWSVAANNDREQPSYGWTLSCGTVRYEAVTTLAAGASPIIQPADLSSWGPTLPAGTYTKITQWGLHESCFLDDIDGIPYIVLGHDGGITRSAGVRS
jgi:hypothetical protein